MLVLACVLLHALQMKRRKMKEISTSDVQDVVSSQYESYEDNDDDVHHDDNDDDNVDDTELSVMHVNRQRSAAVDVDRHDDNYSDDSWRQVADSVVIMSPSNLPQMSTSSLSSWSNAARSRRKRKPPSSRRYCGEFYDSQSASYNDMNKVLCRAVEAECNAHYQMTDVSKSTAARHDSPAYYEQLDCRNHPANALDYDLREAANEEQYHEEQYHLERDLRLRHEGQPLVSQYCIQNEPRNELVHSRSLDDADMSQYDLEYERDDEMLSLSECYGQEEVHYELRPTRSYHEKENMSLQFSRQNDTRPLCHDANYTVSPSYKQNNPGHVRHREKSNLAHYYGQTEPRVYRRSSVQEEDLRYHSGKSDLQYSNRYCEVSSTASQRHNAVPIKSSPDDQSTDQHQGVLVNSVPLPSSADYYWPSSSYVTQMGGWRSDGLTAESLTDHHSAGSPLYDACNFIKVEDSLNQHIYQSASAPIAPAPLPASSSPSSSSLSSSSSPFSIDDHLKRALLAQRNAGDSRQRRRRRHNPSTTAHSLAASRSSNTRVHLPTESSSTSAGVGYLPTRLPFSLPPVPPGYRLVITHRPTSESADDASQVTQLIIDHPSDANALIHDNTTVSSQSLGTSTDSVTPSRTVLHACSLLALAHSSLDGQ